MNYAYETIEGIATRKNDASTESQALRSKANEISLGSADAADNYITYQIINSQHEQTFTSYIENTLIQFDIFSSTQADALELMSLLEDVFDDTTLTVDNYNLIECTRNNSNFVNREEETGLYHYYVEYDINVEQNK